MLEALRSFVGGWVAKVLLGLLVLSFAVWGIQGSILSGLSGNAVAQVGETDVQAREFYAAYQRRVNDIQRRSGARVTREQARLFGIDRQALGEVTAYATLDEFAREQGLGLSDDMLARMLRENDAFKDSTGAFNRDAFTRAVYEAQMRESDYIELQNKSAVRGQLTEAIAAGDVLPAAFDKAMLEYAQTKRDFAYLTVTPTVAGAPPAPTDAQVEAYFEANKQRYAAPEYRTLTILSLTPEDIAKPDAIAAEDVKADYERRIASYRTPERRRVQQLVFPSREKADEAAKALSEGALFESLVTEAGRTIADTDIGLLDKATLQSRSNQAVADAAFTLAPNEVSPVVQGPFGPVMLRVTEITPEATRELSEVEAEIRKDLALRAAADEIGNLQQVIEDRRAGGGTLAQAAETAGVQVRVVEAIDRTARDKDGNVISDLPNSADLIRTAFSTDVGAQAAPLDLGSAGFVWVETTAKEDARDRTLDEIRQKVVADWTADEQAQMVEKKAEELKARLGEGLTLEAIAADAGLDVATTGPLTRNGSTQFFPAEAVQKGFLVGPNASYVADAPNAPTKLLVQVRETTGPTDDKLAEAVRERAQSGAADDLINQMIANLQGRYEIVQNPALIERVVTQGGAGGTY